MCDNGDVAGQGPGAWIRPDGRVDAPNVAAVDSAPLSLRMPLSACISRRPQGGPRELP